MKKAKYMTGCYRRYHREADGTLTDLGLVTYRYRVEDDAEVMAGAETLGDEQARALAERQAEAERFEELLKNV